MNKLTLVDVHLTNATGSDALNTLNVPDIVVADSVATGGNSDGFSYTMTNGQTANVLEAFSTGSNNGGDGQPNSQGSTAHATVNVVRVGGTYQNNPNNITDIDNGTHWNIGVTTSNATANTGGEYRNIYLSGNVVEWFVGGSHGGGGNQPAVVRSNQNSQIRYVSILNTLSNATLVGNSPVLDDSVLVVVNCGTPPPPPTSTTCPATMALGDLGRGLQGQDNATGNGYIMWSQQDVHTRFNGIVATAADHLILVKWNGTQWTYDNNTAFVAFTPNNNDCLVTSINYTTNTATTLQGVSTNTNGIDTGYPSGDLTVVPQQWNGNFNNGEFQAFGTQIGNNTPPPPPPTSTTCPATMALGDLGRGLAGTDNATGNGYIMWSQQDVHTRWSNPAILATAADHLILVKWNGTQWTYDNNSGFTAFTTNGTDCIVAAVNYDADTVTLLNGVNTATNGIDTGYTTGNLSATPNQWNGTFNFGEFEVFGTQIKK